MNQKPTKAPAGNPNHKDGYLPDGTAFKILTEQEMQEDKHRLVSVPWHILTDFSRGLTEQQMLGLLHFYKGISLMGTKAAGGAQ